MHREKLLRSAVVFAGLATLLSCKGLTDAFSPGSSLTSYQSASITATWLGGATGMPLQSKSFFPSTYSGSLCPATSIELENHSGTYTQIFGDVNILVLVGHCTVGIDIAMCAAAGSGGGATDLPTCSTDPTQTPESNLYFTHVSPNSPNPVGTTPVNLTVVVFWCSGGSSFNLGQKSSAASTDCIAP